MTLLAKRTTPLSLTNEINIEDYRILHLTHSKNIELNRLCQNHIKYSPGLLAFKDEEIHAVWKDQILTLEEAEKFAWGYWDEEMKEPKTSKLWIACIFSFKRITALTDPAAKTSL
jgi:tRNA A22 N-methylase